MQSRVLFVILFFIFFVSSTPVLADVAPLLVFLNTQDKGEHFVFIADDGDILIPENDLVGLGVQHSATPVSVEGVNHFSLRDLRDILKYELDEKRGVLNLNVNPRYLRKTVKDFSAHEPVRAGYGIDSAFVNYSIIQRGAENDVPSYEVPLEAVVNAHNVLVKTNFIYHHNATQEYWTRSITSATIDSPQQMRRMVVGDFPATSGELGGSGIFAGFSLAKNFAMTYRFNKFPGISVEGLLESPSKVEVFANDMLIRTEHLPAGAYELSNLPNVYGAGETRVVITDAFGRQTSFSEPYYISTRVLKKGLHDYSYNLGFRRESLVAIESRYEASPTFLGYHTYGVNDDLSAGLRFGLSENVLNLRPTLVHVFAHSGEIEFTGAFSSSAAGQGYGGIARYAYSGKILHGRIASLYTTPSYRTTSLLDQPFSTRRIGSVGAGFHSHLLGSFSATYSFTERHDDTTTESVTLLYSKRLAKMTTLLARAVRTFEQAVTSDAYFVSVNVIIGRRSSINTSYLEEGSHFNRSAYIQRSVPVGPGVGLRARAWNDERADYDERLQSDISATVKTDRFVVSGLYINALESQAYQANVAGSLAYIDNRFHLTRPVQDSFSLVRVGKLDNVRVYYTSEYMGETQNGTLLIPSLVSYSENVLSIDAEDVPVDMALQSTRQSVVPNYRSGVITNFGVARFQGIQGRVFVKEKGRRRSADFAEILLAGATHSEQSIVGNNGEFYFENLAAGAYDGTVMLEGKQCGFTLSIPDSEDMIVDVGEVVCELAR